MTRIGGILLAAGEASRFGAPKQAASLGPQTLLQRSVEQLQAADLQERVVVLGAHLERVAPLLPVAVATAYNAHWQAGMLGSLQTGLRFFLGSGAALDAIFVMMGDQPDFSADHIDRYLQAARAALPLRPLPRSTFEKILTLPRKGKLRPLLAELADAVYLPEGPHLRDIDTQRDLDKWLEK